jgi:hypothetical protein
VVLYDYDGNIIQAEPMKNRSDTEAIRAYTRIYDELTAKGLTLTFQKMDNEASQALKQFLQSKDIQFQLVPPHLHRKKAAERAIQTFKNYFVAILCATDKHFPLHLWDRFIPQAVLTLNLLRQSRVTSKLSAHAQLQVPFDYNATPLAPPGTKVIIHENPDQRGLWSPHGLNGWYIDPAMEHYRTHIVYCSTVGDEIISDTVEFPPQHCKVPGISSADAASIAAADLTQSLLQPTTMTPRLASPQPPQAQATRVTNTTNHPKVTKVTKASPYKPCHSPRAHIPPQVTQEERAYQLMAVALPKIEYAHSVTDVVTEQQMEYRHLLQRPDGRLVCDIRPQKAEQHRVTTHC